MTHWRSRDANAGAPLCGVRVLDFSELLPGPFLTQSLAELGADVLKIERPPHGDPLRRLSPSLFTAVNRGKRSLQINLKDEAQHAKVLALADQADVLLEQYRPGVVDRLGLGYATLAARNPRLVYASLSGYGADGPRAQWPGHDINYLAVTGLVALAGTEADPTARLGVPMADLASAGYGLAAINAALFQRERSGRGQQLDIAISDCAAHWMNSRWAAIRHAGAESLAAQRQVAQQRAAYGVFRCRDGGLISVAALETHFWQALVQCLGLTGYTGDEWLDPARRAEHAAVINGAVQAALEGLPADRAMALLIAADVPAAHVAVPTDVPRDAQFRARSLFVETAAGPLARFPVRLAGMPPMPPDAPPMPSRHPAPTDPR